MKCPECGADNCFDLDCDECQGNGHIGDDYKDSCENCNGDGIILNWYECEKCGETFED